MDYRRSIPTHLAAAALLLAGTASVCLADDPVQDWYLDTLPRNSSAIDSKQNLALGGLDRTDKYAPDGTKLWSHGFSIGGGHTLMTWLAVDSADNVIRGGYQEGANGGYLAVKYDPDGNLLWSTVADLGDSEESIRVELDEFDNLYLFGEAYDNQATKRWLTVKIDPNGQVQWHQFGTVAEPVALAVRGGQVVCFGRANGGDFVTVSYDYGGSQVWEKLYQPGSWGTHMAIGPDGQVVVCGWGSSGFQTSAGTVVQYDSLGNEMWVALYNGPNGGTEIFHRLAIDDTGAVIAVGFGLSAAPDDAWSVVKFDPSGAVVWTQLYDNVSYTGYEYAYTVSVGPGNSVYVGGLSDRVKNCGFGSLEGHVVKYSADGTFQWNHHLGCGADPNRIHIDQTGALYTVTGWQILRLREPVGDTYCAPAVSNSSGLPGVIQAIGSTTASHGELTLTADQLPPDSFGYFLASQTQGFVSGPGGSQGNLCLGGTIGRFTSQVQKSGPAGTFSISVDLGQIPTSPPEAVLPGQTWRFQAWFRDKNPGQTSNFTDAVSVRYK